jgi:hypothetical protein
MAKSNFQSETIIGTVKKNYTNIVQINISNKSITTNCKMLINGIERVIPVMDDGLPISDFTLSNPNYEFDIEIEFVQAESVVVDYFTVIPTPKPCE